jgi:hypothetical protein
MKRSMLAGLAMAVLGVSFGFGAMAQSPPPKNDYADTKNWAVPAGTHRRRVFRRRKRHHHCGRRHNDA